MVCFDWQNRIPQHFNTTNVHFQNLRGWNSLIWLGIIFWLPDIYLHAVSKHVCSVVHSNEWWIGGMGKRERDRDRRKRSGASSSKDPIIWKIGIELQNIYFRMIIILLYSSMICWDFCPPRIESASIPY